MLALTSQPLQFSEFHAIVLNIQQYTRDNAVCFVKNFIEHIVINYSFSQGPLSTRFGPRLVHICRWRLFTPLDLQPQMCALFNLIRAVDGGVDNLNNLYLLQFGGRNQILLAFKDPDSDPFTLEVSCCDS
jgi:hypothetical protein